MWKVNAYLVRSDGSERPALQWLRRYVALPLPPVLVSPVGTNGVPRNPILIWRSSNSAKAYHLQVSTGGGFSTVLVDTTVADTLFQMQPLAASTRHYWHVSAANDSGESSYASAAAFVTGSQTVAVEEAGISPREFVLLQNYPNPFNPRTVINYTVGGVGGQGSGAGNVRLAVYDLLGREVAVLVNENKPAGSYEAQFDGTGLSSAVYMYRLTAGEHVASRKMVLTK
jgi:hypothetical protein